MALTPDQKNNVRAAIAAKNAQQSTALRDKMIYEQKRDALAYDLVRTSHAAHREDPTIPELAFGDAQKIADEQLAAPAKADKPARPAKPTPEPVAPPADAPAA